MNLKTIKQIMLLLKSVMPTYCKPNPIYFSTPRGLMSKSSSGLSLIDIEIEDWNLPFDARISGDGLENFLDSAIPTLSLDGKDAKLSIEDPKQKYKLTFGAERSPLVPSSYLEVYEVSTSEFVNAVEKYKNEKTIVLTNNRALCVGSEISSESPIAMKPFAATPFSVAYLISFTNALKQISGLNLEMRVGKDLEVIFSGQVKGKYCLSGEKPEP